MGLLIRSLADGDHRAILDIYNHYVTHSHCTFDTLPFSLASRMPWFAQFNEPLYQCMVAALDGRVVGYACSMPFKAKPAYRTSVEVSVYTAPDHNGGGAGSALYRALFEALGSQPLHRAYAGIAIPNEASIALHHKFEFERVALFREVGYKFDRYWDVAWYEKPL